MDDILEEMQNEKKADITPLQIRILLNKLDYHKRDKQEDTVMVFLFSSIPNDAYFALQQMVSDLVMQFSKDFVLSSVGLTIIK